MSISGTVVLHGKSDEAGTLRSSKSRLGMEDKASSSSNEDSATNLAEVVYIRTILWTSIVLTANVCPIINDGIH